MTDMADGKTRIVVDDRERPTGIVEELGKQTDALVTVERMSIGDYRIDDYVLIERKCAADFAKSLIDGRLFEQAGRMVGTEFRPLYLLEGTAAEWANTGVTREALQGALITLALIFDIPVLRSVDLLESAHLIVYSGGQLRRLQDPNYVASHQRKAKNMKTRRLRVLQSFPGVGADRASRLLEHFDTLRLCLAASEEQLCEVKGIGRKTAKLVSGVLDARASEASPLCRYVCEYRLNFAIEY
jgi:DNA excision repair protein ERCC-4